MRQEISNAKSSLAKRWPLLLSLALLDGVKKRVGRAFGRLHRLEIG